MESKQLSAAAWDRPDIQTQASVEMEQHNGTAIVRIRGVIDTSNADDIELALQTGAAANGPGLVVELTGVEYLNSAAIKMLVGLSEQLRARGKELRVVIDDTAPMRKVLATIHFERLVPLHRTVKGAAAQMTVTRVKGDVLPSSDAISTS